MRPLHPLLALLAFLAAALPARAEPDQLSQQPAFTIGAWSGIRYLAADGAIVSCGVTTSASARDGMAINLLAGGLTISVSREGWKFGKGAVAAEFIVDGVTIAAQAEATDTGVLRIIFGAPDDRAVYDRLGTGSMLEIRTRKGNQTYDLTGLDKVMPALYDCAAGRPATARSQANPDALPVMAQALPATPFDVPGATRVERSQVMVVLANVLSKEDGPRHEFMLDDELAAALPGYDVGWRSEDGVLSGTAVRGRVGTAGLNVIIGNLLGLDAARCAGKMRIEIDPPDPAEDRDAKDIHTYCDGGGNGKEAHYLVHAFSNGGTMITRFEPVSMKDPKQLIHDIYED